MSNFNGFMRLMSKKLMDASGKNFTLIYMRRGGVDQDSVNPSTLRQHLPVQMKLANNAMGGTNSVGTI